MSDEFDDEDTTALGLRLHNEYRKKHGAPPIAFTKELCSLAEDYGNAHARGTKMKCDDTKRGQNLFRMDHFSEEGMNTDTDAVKAAMQNWYESGKNYNFDSPATSPEDTKAFQELVWKGTLTGGIGVGSGKDGFVVAALYIRERNPDSLEAAQKENVLPGNS